MTRRKSAGVSKRIRFLVFRRDGYRCTYCGRRAPEVELHVDHYRAVATGGTDDIDNLRTACADCNLGKAALSPVAPLTEHELVEGDDETKAAFCDPNFWPEPIL